MHIPVLLKEVIYYLDPKPADKILDATINGGGHAAAICELIGLNGKLIGIDQDKELLKAAELKIKNAKCKIILINGNFRDLDELLEPLNIKSINGALFDLGISSVQLEDSGRGFSFQKDEPLSMTYKSDIGPNDLTAKEIINKWSERDIADVLYKYGEERYSRRIARRITERRREKPIKTTSELVEIIRLSVPPAYRNNRRIHCATRTFQALRIAVNDELDAMKEGIEKAWGLISKDSRLVVISFHSLEDRIVKNFFRKISDEGRGQILTKKPVTPNEEEQKLNPRSRSAKLRAIKKI
jgi:16S rRNA (cytosine1402-N4)-methyltransferase